MNPRRQVELWENRDQTGIYPAEVTEEEATETVADEEKKSKTAVSVLKNGYGKETASGQTRYFRLDTYTDADFEDAKFRIQVKQLSFLETIRNWIVLWSVLAIFVGILAFLIQYVL